jgi:hypothetical protein
MGFKLIEEPIEVMKWNAPQRIQEIIYRIYEADDDGWSVGWGSMSNEEQDLLILVIGVGSEDLLFCIDGLLIRVILGAAEIECWIIGYIYPPEIP